MGRFRYTATVTDKATGETRTEEGIVQNASPLYEKQRARADVANHVRTSPSEQIDVDVRYA